MFLPPIACFWLGEGGAPYGLTGCSVPALELVFWLEEGELPMG